MNEENQHAAVEPAAPAAETPLSAVEPTDVAVEQTQPHTPSAEEGKGVQPKERAPRKPKPQVDSVEDLLKLAYESNARLLEFPKESLKKLPITDESITAQGALIASLSPTDPTLATPFKLLQYVARQGVDLKRAEDGDLARVLRRLVDLSIMAMSSHPVFRVWTDQLLDPRREPQLSPQHVRDEAGKVDAEKLGLAADQFKAADGDRLVKNAVASYGLLRAVQRDWNLDRYIDESNDSSWKHEVPEAPSLERAVGTIGSSRDLDVLGLVAANYIARIARLDRQIAQLERAVDTAANRESRLNEELQAATASEQAATARAEAFSADIVRLQKELAAERDNRVVDKSHMADDYETLRTRIIRRLSGEIDLLTDGLHALRNGAPSVAEEFLDRSLLALAREVEQLKDAAGGLA
ncbi:hypothetical protein ABZ860_27525 [Microbispora sp. NPDC046973]|uniref:hypothetical protein n=1 Tax=Microbispora sp. NPDC046973 TaxID=3155022 RepID=UPI0033EF7576